MTNSQLLDHACTLRDQGRFREAYDEFLLAANKTDSILEKAGILLNAVTNLTQTAQCQIARTQLDKVRELLSTLDPNTLGPADRDEFFGVTIGVEIEEAEILAAEDQVEKAIEKLTMILEEFKSKLKESGLLHTYDDVQSRRAFFLTDIGSFRHAIPILEEIETRQNHNPVFLFYLGHCYLVAKEFTKARQKLERAISLAPPPSIEFQSHGSLGMVLYELGEYASAKQELERSAELATARYIKEAKIWKWLQNTCISLGLKDEAEHYRRLLEPC